MSSRHAIQFRSVGIVIAAALSCAIACGQPTARSIKPTLVGAATGQAAPVLPYHAMDVAPKGKWRAALATPAQILLIDFHVTLDGEQIVDARKQWALRLLENKAKRQPKPTKPAKLPPLEDPALAIGAELADNSLVSSASDFSARLNGYEATTGRALDSAETLWLLERWAGPPVLRLSPLYQRIRRNKAPAFHIVDADGNGRIDSAECAAAVQRLLDCDANQDEIVTFAELDRKATKRTEKNRRTAAPQCPPQPLLFLTAPRKTAAGLQAWRNAYAGQSVPARLGLSHDQLLQETPDIVATVDFNSANGQASQFHIASSAASSSFDQSHVTGVSLRIGGIDLECHAATVLHNTEPTICFGAVDDGFPLLPRLDRNNDRQISLRELLSLEQRLLQLDANGDGQVDGSELRPTIRCVVGRGLVAHEVLRDIRREHAPPTSDRPAAPEWFRRSDRNSDGDLSPKEFLGTDEQFQQLDKNGDGLISPDEALKNESTQP